MLGKQREDHCRNIIFAVSCIDQHCRLSYNEIEAKISLWGQRNNNFEQQKEATFSGNGKYNFTHRDDVYQDAR
jgi:hypothetical protein